MNKTFYSRYVDHCIRFRIRHPHPSSFNSVQSKEDWQAVNNALCDISDDERSVLSAIYRSRDEIEDAIACASATGGLPEGKICKLIYEFRSKVATYRGLSTEHTK